MLKILWYFITHHFKDIKLTNLYQAIKEQGPLKRALKNFFGTGNAWGMFHINSHISSKGEKIGFNKNSALKGAEKMSKKHGVHFSVYKCVFCDKYHIGKNKDNKYNE